MRRENSCQTTVLLLACLAQMFFLSGRPLHGQTDGNPPYRIRLEEGHPWRPPFGLERVGQPLEVVLEANDRPPAVIYTLIAYRSKKEIIRRPVSFSGERPFFARVAIDGFADELVLISSNDPKHGSREIARQTIQPRAIEAEAVLRPDQRINPVDLGAILVPSGWLLLGPDQSAALHVAAMSRAKDLPNARVLAWFESDSREVVSVPVPLRERLRTVARLKLPARSSAKVRDVLRVALDDGEGREIWRKSIPAMFVAEPPRWPRFGASYTKLRYDAPISVRDPAKGTFSSLRYEDGWDPSLKDIVVSFPNGARFVFWRGSSYIPFWAGRDNTGACYEWAEMLSRPPDVVDCVEPLMDKELRYGRVEIIESSLARVHVRWTYQSTDLQYKIWGDAAVEDYYFYPDGFGTRVLSLKSDPKNDYELSEFIILTPQDAYPFDVLPENLVDVLFVDGRKRELRFPHIPGVEPGRTEGGDSSAIYRLRLAKDEKLAAIYFHPHDRKPPPHIFGPFSDRGQVVTPCYWGSHWPLARGNATGSAIDDRIHFSPCHNSVMTWASSKPAPIRASERQTLDTLGRARPMTIQTWAWLVGMTDASDDRLVEWAKSFAAPPSLEVRGARLDFDAYIPERRAIRFNTDGREVSVRIKPAPVCVNPVFELEGAPRGAIKVTLAGDPVDADRMAWDGRTLWLDATIRAPTELHIMFMQAQEPRNDGSKSVNQLR
jgi:hypothetical protein